MSLRVVEVSGEEEFLAVVRVLYASFHDPFNPFYEILNNVEGTLEEQLEKKAESHASQWRNSTTQHWVKVTEHTGDCEQVIAVCAWRIQTKASDTITPDAVAVWHTEGSLLRDFATQWIRGMKSAKTPFTRNPHLEVEQLATLPSHRRRGCSTMLLNWGLRKADERGLDVIVAAVPSSVGFYQALNFTTKEIFDPKVEVNRNDEEWKRLACHDYRMHCMVRSPRR